MINESKIIGIEEALKNLASLDATVGKKTIRQALRKGADHLISNLQANAPKDSGELANSINRVRRKENVLGEDEYAVSTGKAFWGAFIEFGTGIRRPKNSNVLMDSSGTLFGKEAKGIKPNPWFTRTWEGSKVGVLEVIKESIKKRIFRIYRTRSK